MIMNNYYKMVAERCDAIEKTKDAIAQAEEDVRLCTSYAKSTAELLAGQVALVAASVDESAEVYAFIADLSNDLAHIGSHIARRKEDLSDLNATLRRQEKALDEYGVAYYVGVKNLSTGKYSGYQGTIQVDKDATSLQIAEHIFYVLNNEHPADYRLPSLSVGDTVSFRGEEYVCLSSGWRKVR